MDKENSTIYKYKILKYQQKYKYLHNQFDQDGGSLLHPSTWHTGLTKKEKQIKAYNDELNRLYGIDTSDSEDLEYNRNLDRNIRIANNNEYRAIRRKTINSIKDAHIRRVRRQLVNKLFEADERGDYGYKPNLEEELRRNYSIDYNPTRVDEQRRTLNYNPRQRNYSLN